MTKARTLADNFAADINGITAGTGITGGGTSGTVTVTNSMATAIDAKGDLVVGTGADTFSRLAVASTAGYLLSVDSAESTGLKWAAPAGGGKVLQVVTATTSTSQSTTSTTFTDTNLTASITPSLATSKILVLTNQAFQFSRSSSKVEAGFRLMRDSTRIAGSPDANSPDDLALEVTGGTFVYLTNFYAYSYLDSPATTSSVTYKTQSALQTTANSAIITSQPLSLISSIILMEIGA